MNSKQEHTFTDEELEEALLAMGSMNSQDYMECRGLLIALMYFKDKHGKLPSSPIEMVEEYKNQARKLNKKRRIRWTG